MKGMLHAIEPKRIVKEVCNRAKALVHNENHPKQAFGSSSYQETTRID